MADLATGMLRKGAGHTFRSAVVRRLRQAASMRRSTSRPRPFVIGWQQAVATFDVQGDRVTAEPTLRSRAEWAMAQPMRHSGALQIKVY
jgi:hypothetical protein